MVSLPIHKRLLAPNKPPRQPRRRARRHGTWVLVFALCIASAFAGIQWVNTPATQRMIVGLINRHTSWEIQLDHWEWQLFSNTLSVVDLRLFHRTTGNFLHTDRILIHYSPWGLPAGRFTIRNLLVDNVTCDFSTMPPPSKHREPIDIKKLLILQNLTVKTATVSGIMMTLPNHRRLETGPLRLQLLPSLTADVRLNVQVDTSRLSNDSTTLVQLGQLTFVGTTQVNRWVNTPPFVNAAKGSLSINDATWRQMTVNSLRSVFSFDHSRFGLEHLNAEVNHQMLQGNGHIDLEEETYAVDLQWPTPMPIPELFGPNEFLRSAGTIQGTIALKGHGFSPRQSTGEGMVDLTQVPAAVTTIPLHLTGRAHWTNGILSIAEGKLAMENGLVQIAGGVNWAQEQIRLQFHGERMPMAGVFGRFTDDDFHPVSGVASVEGSFNGWGHNYLLDLTADATPGSYYDIAVERARARLRLTYPRLELNGEIFQGQRTTGQCALTITYGSKIGDQPRSKQLQLQAHVDGHNLGPSFTAYHLQGMGKGSLTLTGRPENFRATGDATIDNGAFYAIPLQHLQTKLALAPHLITYSEGSLELPKSPPVALPNPLKMMLNPQGFRLSGTPRPGLNIDLGYEKFARLWTIRALTYTDAEFPDRHLTITGNGKADHWNLGIRGVGNLALLEYLPSSVREATGPVTLDLRLQGALDAPSLQGTAQVHGATLLLRNLPYHLEDIEGTVRFQGRDIRFDPLSGRTGDGTFRLTGSVRQAGFALTNYDVHLQGSSVHFASRDRHFRAELDGALAWQGDQTHSIVSGDVTILEAKYDRDFRVLEEINGGAAAARAELRLVQEGWERIGLNVHVRNSGDIWIRNNAADVALRADTQVLGSLAHPQVRGAVEVTQGKLHYLGLNFDISRGLVEFHAPYAHPYIEMTGEKEVRDYLVQITLRGPADNLALDLSSTPGLERKDILSLLAFGATQEELRTAQFGAQIGPSIFLEQVGKLVERPLSKLTGLDVVRVETQIGSGGRTQGSRLYLGKRLSDRLAVEFVTGVNEQSSEQGFQVEYNLTDFLLLKAGQPAGEKTRVNMTLRFRER